MRQVVRALLWLPAGVLVLIYLGHQDILGLCPMAVEMIDADSGVSGYEKALKSWEEFADYYDCRTGTGGK